MCRGGCLIVALAAFLAACSSDKEGASAEEAEAASGASSSSAVPDVPTPTEGPSASGGAAPSPAELCRPEDPDVERDACLGCLVGECCDGAAGPCLSFVRYHFDDDAGTPIDQPVVSRRCYEGHFACVRACFARRQPPATPQEAWEAVGSCSVECDGDVGDDLPFPMGESSAAELLRCVVGDVPPTDEADDVERSCVAECLPEWPG